MEICVPHIHCMFVGIFVYIFSVTMQYMSCSTWPTISYNTFCSENFISAFKLLIANYIASTLILSHK